MEGNLEQSREESNEAREREALLDVLESAFEKGAKAELTVSEPSGGLRTNEIFVRGLEAGTLYVSSSMEGVVMGIPLDNVKGAKLAETKEN